MKSRILPAFLMIVFLAACNNTFEIGIEGSPTSIATMIVQPTAVPLPTASPFPQPSPTLQVQVDTRVPTEVPIVRSVQIFLIAIDDNGQGGPLVGCGDSVIPVQVEISPTQAVLKAAMEAMLSLKTQYYGESGLYNALYQSNLQLESIKIASTKASVYLTGTLTMGGECDIPRVQAQLERTALQFPTVTEAEIFINGKPLADVLSLK
jgi:hypothetical protein